MNRNSDLGCARTKCINCNLEVDETIVHFLGECNFYEQFRLQYFAGKLFLFDDYIRILNESIG